VRRARIARDADRSRAVVSGGGTGGVRDAAEAVERDRAPVSRERRFERTTKPLNPQSEPRFQRLLKGNAGELTFRRLLHPRDTRRAPWRTGDVRVNRARPLAACEGGRRSLGLARACHRSKHSEMDRLPHFFAECEVPPKTRPCRARDRCRRPRAGIRRYAASSPDEAAPPGREKRTPASGRPSQ
jgi:hypothetical protein